nr:hypothetical protein [Tanacetum cinerariifolium]
MVKNDRDGCAEKLKVLENQNSELSQMNKDQALCIKELEDELARKDYARVYTERINFEMVQEKEKLVAQLSKTKMEKFDCIRKLLPTVVECLFQIHEYKQSLSKLFNRLFSFRHNVSDLLKVYLDSPPFGQAPPSKSSFEKAHSSSALKKT